MKRRSKWDEKSIEKQLKIMPKIDDVQSKDVLYEQIQEKLQEEQIRQNKRKGWFLPAIATAAVFILLLLLVPSFLNNEENMSIEETNNEAGIMMETNEYPAEDGANIGEDSANLAGIKEAIPSKNSEQLRNKNYFGATQPAEERQLGGDLVTIAISAIFDRGEFVIPVSLKSEGETKLDRFINAKNNFNGEYLGIGSFPQFEINSITEEATGVVVIDFPKGSLESISSANDNLYKLALQETFSSLGYNEIKFTSDGEPGVFWGQYGPLQGLEVPNINRGYYLFKSNTEHQFLVKGSAVNAPRSTEEQVSFQETLELMKNGDSEMGYHASIPEEVIISNIEQIGDQVTITFAEGVIVGDKLEYLIMLEAIMFAAKDFGFNFIQFEGIEIDQIGPYYSKDVIEIPDFINFIQ